MKEFKIFKLLLRTYDNLLNDIAKNNNLTLNELKILIFLKDNDKSPIAKNIVEGLGVTKSHISMSLCKLEENGYIVKTQDKNDRKKSNLSITSKSLPIIEKAKDVQKTIKHITIKGITSEEQQMLNTIFRKIANNLEEYNQLLIIRKENEK